MRASSFPKYSGGVARPARDRGSAPMAGGGRDPMPRTP